MASVIETSEPAILSRVIVPELGDLPPEVARAFLDFHFDPKDRERMHELAVKSQEGSLDPDEEVEMSNYRNVGHLLDLMKSKARLSLRRSEFGS